MHLRDINGIPSESSHNLSDFLPAMIVLEERQMVSTLC